MRKFPRFVSRQLGRFFTAESILKIHTPVFLPFYHVVSDMFLPHVANYPFRNTAQFEKELDFMLLHYQPVTLDKILENPFPKKKVFHLSFDDGLKECAEVIAPVLLQKGIPATFFVNTGFIDNRGLFHRYKASLLLRHLENEPVAEAQSLLKAHQLEGKEILQATILQNEILDRAARIAGLDFDLFLQEQKPYLTTGDLISLQKQGFTIGSHGVNHPEFWLIPEDRQWEEVKQSMEWLVKNVNPRLKTFSFPYTDSGVSKQLIEKIHQEKLCEITFGTAGIKFDEVENHFQRYPVETGGDFTKNLKSEVVYFVLRHIAGKATVRHAVSAQPV